MLCSVAATSGAADVRRMCVVMIECASRSPYESASACGIVAVARVEKPGSATAIDGGAAIEKLTELEQFVIAFAFPACLLSSLPAQLHALWYRA